MDTATATPDILAKTDVSRRTVILVFIFSFLALV